MIINKKKVIYFGYGLNYLLLLSMPKRKKKSKIKKYCRCENCGTHFEITKRRKYCTDSCKSKAYYKRKGQQTYQNKKNDRS